MKSANSAKATRLGLAMALSLLVASTGLRAAPEAKLLPHWQQHSAASSATIDHDAWTRWLGDHVQAGSPNRIDYEIVSSNQIAALDDYLTHLQRTRISDFNRRQQKAFWLNLYNATTVRLVIRHAPVDSIREIHGGLFNTGPWDEPLVSVEGRRLSLNDIEHGILRPIWQDPLIHYGVNCASVGCPDLIDRAFTADTVNDALRDNASRFINSPRGVQFEDGRLVVSSIYKWFASDFGGTEAGILAHLRRFAGPDLRARLESASSIDDYRYDWSLNGLP